MGVHVRDDVLGGIGAIVSKYKAGNRLDGPCIVSIVDEVFNSGYNIATHLIHGENLGQDTLLGAEFFDGIGPGYEIGTGRTDDNIFTLVGKRCITI